MLAEIGSLWCLDHNNSLKRNPRRAAYLELKSGLGVGETFKIHPICDDIPTMMKLGERDLFFKNVHEKVLLVDRDGKSWIAWVDRWHAEELLISRTI